MKASQAYKAITSKQIRLKNEAHADGWSLPEYHGSKVVMNNKKTGESAVGTRKWSTSANDWGNRVSFD